MEFVKNADNVDKSKHSEHEKPQNDNKPNCTEHNNILTRSYNYVQNGKVTRHIHILDCDNPILLLSDMEEQILEENPFAELKTEIDVINGTHSFASSVITENNDLEFVYKMVTDIRKESHKCSICDKWFYKESTFINHMKYHDTQKKTTSKCSSCGCLVTFIHERDLAIKDNKANDYSTKSFKCKVCQVLF